MAVPTSRSPRQAADGFSRPTLFRGVAGLHRLTGPRQTSLPASVLYTNRAAAKAFFGTLLPPNWLKKPPWLRVASQHFRGARAVHPSSVKGTGMTQPTAYE